MRSISLWFALLLALLTPGLTQAQDDATPLPPEVACAEGADAMYIKEIMPLVQTKSRQLADTTENISNKAASPFMAMESGQAKLKAERDYVIASLRRKKDGS